MKLFKFYNYWTDFIADKISNSEDNTTWYDFDHNVSILGTPNVMYNQVCFIEDRKCIWTHGQKYTSAEAAGVSQEDITLAIKKHTDKLPNFLVRYIAPAMIYEETTGIIPAYNIDKDDDGVYGGVTSYLIQFESATDQPSYVNLHTTYKDENGTLQYRYRYYAYGHAGLMDVDSVRSMKQSWHAVRFMPEKIVGYTSSGADLTSAYITSYYKAEEGAEYPTTWKIFNGKKWTGKFEKKKEYGAWKSEKTQIPVASKYSAGVISAEDKVKLDSLGILSNFTVSSESGNSTGEKIIREKFSPSNSTFKDLVSVNFKKGDYISISADLSACEKTECEMIAIGKDISSWGTGLESNKGVFHVYHKYSGSTHTILVNYVDKNNQSGLKYNGTKGLSITGDTVDIEVGYDTDLLKPYFTVNGTNLIGTSTFMAVNSMNEWLDQKSLYVGSVSEATTGKLTNILYNYIKIIKGAATSVDGVKVQYSIGNDDNEFIIPNATTTSNGAMSLDDKKKLDELKEYSVATQTEDGLMSKEDKIKLDNLTDQSGTGTDSSLPLQLQPLSEQDPTGYDYTYMYTAYYGNGKGGYPLIITADNSQENIQGNNELISINIGTYRTDDNKKYLKLKFTYMGTTFTLNMAKLLELGIITAD